MLWLIITIIAYLFGAVTHLFDKYLLKKTMMPNPGALTFYIGALGVLGLALAPWGFALISYSQIALDLFSGIVYLTAILLFFYALNKADVSQVASLIGGLTPLFILLGGFLFSSQMLNSAQLVAFALIVSGSFIIGLEKRRGHLLAKNVLWLCALSALLFSCAHLLSQFIYQQQGFINGFIWVRLGGVLGALLLLLLPQVKKSIVKDFKKPSQGKALVFMAGQTCGALNFILFNYAFTLGPLALISALGGLQYVFLFLMVLFLSWKMPQVIKEKITTRIILQKSISIALIAIGIGILAS
ncbi:MAG: DMT family transporter [Candidatus Gribaldobacteria bacterium]|nr:DMT family transporter [Candidatus Gribaldobacteria bacterium]